MAEKRWTNLNPENVKREPKNRAGVYILQSSSGAVVYIGHGKLSSTLSSHLVDTGSNVIEGATKYWYKKARNDEKAAQASDNLLNWFKGQYGDVPSGNGGSPTVISAPEPVVEELPAAEETTPELNEAPLSEDETTETTNEDEPQVIADGLDDEEKSE